jgi:hypothetical protein
MDRVPWNARAQLYYGGAIAEEGVLGSCLGCWRRLRPEEKEHAFVVCEALIWLREWEAPTPRLQYALIDQVASRQGSRVLVPV